MYNVKFLTEQRPAICLFSVIMVKEADQLLTVVLYFLHIILDRKRQSNLIYMSCDTVHKKKVCELFK